jgi:hypothetical protein
VFESQLATFEFTLYCLTLRPCVYCPSMQDQHGGWQPAGRRRQPSSTRHPNSRALCHPGSHHRPQAQHSEADLAEDPELAELAAVAAQDGTAAPATRSKRAASGRLLAVLAVLAVLALEHQLQD